MIAKAIKAVVIGLVTFLVVLIVLTIVSALLPGVNINAGLWASLIGLLAGLYYFLTGAQLG